MNNHQNFHHGQFHWLVNLAASSLILFAVIGSLALFVPEITHSSVAAPAHAASVRQDTLDRSYLLQASPDKEILNLKPKAENNAFSRVRKVTA